MSVETRENLGHSGADPENLAIGATTSTSKALFAYLEAELASFDVQHQAAELSVQETEALIEDTEEALPVTKEPTTSTSKALFAYLETELADIAEQFKELDITGSPLIDESDRLLVHIDTDTIPTGLVQKYAEPAEVEQATVAPLIDVHAGVSADGSLSRPTTREKFYRRMFSHEKTRTGVRRHISLGATAMTLCVAAGALFVASSTSDPERPSLPTSVETSAPVTTVISIDTTPTTTEVEPVPVPFEAEVGEVIGTLKFLSTCEDVEIVEFNGLERINEIIGTGGAVIDRIDIDPTPNEGCPTVDQRERELEQLLGRDVVRRTERTRDRLKSPDNPDGKVSIYQPVGGHQQNPDGSYGSPFPGQEGNVVFVLHGSTWNGAGGDFPFIREGDISVFTRSDGKDFYYKMVGAEPLDPNDPEPFYNYSHPESPSTMTTFICASKEGETGDDEIRLALRWVLLPTIPR